MTDIGAAAADAAQPSVDPTIVSEPNPISTEPQKAADPEKAVEPPKSEADKRRESIERAAEKVAADEKADEGKDKQADKKAAERDETGKFKGKDTKAEPAADPNADPKTAQQQDPKQTATDKPVDPAARKPHDDPPKRFASDEAVKADWIKAPESVRAATHRAVRELEDGIAEHQRFREPLKPYDELARINKTDLPSALKRYVAFDVMLSNDPIKAFHTIAQDKNLDLKKIAAHILGQPAPTQDQNQQTIARLEARITQLQRQIEGVGGTVHTQQATHIKGEVEAFAADKPDFDILSGAIAQIIQSEGLTLEQAYQKAKTHAHEVATQLGFSAPAPAQTRTEDPKPADAQTVDDKGSKSITGAPTAGATPGKKRSTSIREAVTRAMNSVS